MARNAQPPRSSNRAQAKPKPAAPKKPAAAASPAPGIDAALLRTIAELVSANELTELEIKTEEFRIRAARAPAGTAIAAAQATPVHAPAPQPAFAAPRPAGPVSPPQEAAVDYADAVKSPMVGTAYLRPNPESKPFIEIGSRVSIGDKLMLIEAMKTFNDIVATKAGVVTAILVDDGQPVEYGEPLLVIE